MAQYDLYMQPLPETQQPAPRPITFYYATPRAVQGPWKPVGRFLRCLLTPAGSDPLDPNYGTNFPNLINSNISDLNAAIALVALEVQSAADQVKRMDAGAGLPDRERLSSATVTKASARGVDGIDVYVGITNEAGETIVTALPPVTDTR